MRWMPENPGMNKNQPASLLGTRVLAQAAKRAPTLVFPLDDKKGKGGKGGIRKDPLSQIHLEL